MSVIDLISAGINVPVYILGVLVLISLAVTFIFVLFATDIKKYAPESIILKEARKKHLPILMIHDAAGRCEFTLGKKGKKGDITYKTDAYGIYIDQRIQGMPPEDRLKDGVPIYHYATNFSFPISGKNARSLETIIAHVRKNYPQLAQINDLEIIELLGTDADELVHDCSNICKEYDLKTSDFTVDPEFLFDATSAQTEQEKDRLILYAMANEMSRLIHIIQDETSVLPAKTEYFSYTHAFKLIPSAFLSQDVHQLKMLLERMVRKEQGAAMMQLAAYGTFILMILVGAGVAYKMISG